MSAPDVPRCQLGHELVWWPAANNWYCPTCQGFPSTGPVPAHLGVEPVESAPAWMPPGRLRPTSAPLLVWGIVLTVLGAGAFALESNNHTACQSAFVQGLAGNQCARDDLIYAVGIVLAIVGAVLVVVSLVRRR